MQQTAARQLDSIHAMLSAGHRSLRIERHSLLLWGAGSGALMLASNDVITPDQFPTVEQRGVAWLVLLAVVGSGIGLVDWHLTRSAKQARDEAWSSIHRQVLKVWWLLVFVGVMFTFATFFYGGGYMIFAAWVVLLGMGLYVQGLFSEDLLEWIGVVAIGLGIAMLALHLDYADQRWLAGSTFAFGLPLLSVMLGRGTRPAPGIRLIQSAAWLACVLTPPLLAHPLHGADCPPDTPVVSLQESPRQPKQRQAVLLPAGSAIPVKVEVSQNTGPELHLPLIVDGHGKPAH